MNTKLFIIALAVFIAIGTIAVFASQSHVHHIALLSTGAEPDALAVKVDEKVQFDSKDGSTHDIASGGGDEYGHDHDHAEGPESGIFDAGEAYLVTFSKAGVYHFHDHKHPNVFVTVIAYDP